jgi:hypothetical protein
MNTSIEIYLGRISSALTKWVLPEVKTEHAESQLRYAIDLLNQLKMMTDHRIGLIQKDYQWSEEIYKIVESALKPLGINVGDELKMESTVEALPPDCSECAMKEKAMKMKVASSKALDLFYKEKNKIDHFSDVESKIYDIMQQWAIRDITLYYESKRM